MHDLRVMLRQLDKYKTQEIRDMNSGLGSEKVMATQMTLLKYSTAEISHERALLAQARADGQKGVKQAKEKSSRTPGERQVRARVEVSKINIEHHSKGIFFT